MKPKEKFLQELLHIKKAFGFAWKGLCAAWETEIAFRQEVLASIVIIPFALYFGHSTIARALMIASWLLVLVVELINTALEMLVDRISVEQHPLSAKIKDIGAACVLASIVQAVVVWAIILFNA